MKDLTAPERRALRARAHGLYPVVTIGNAGLTPHVLHEIDIALKSHELIKIRMLGVDRKAREDALERICDALDAHPVQAIGKILVVYRPAPQQETDSSPAPTKERVIKQRDRRRAKREK